MVNKQVIAFLFCFYLFALPFYDSIFWLALAVSTIALLAALLVWEEGGVVRLRHLQEPQGDPLVLHCNTRGLPEPTITWLKDGQPLDTSMGRLKPMTVPCPTSLVSHIFPPCNSTRLLQIASPKPEPSPVGPRGGLR